MLRERFEARGLPIAPHLFPPEILDNGHYLIDAFMDLEGDRSMGMGIGPIHFLSIDRYAERLGLIDDDFWFFHDMLRAMDTAYLKQVNAADD